MEEQEEYTHTISDENDEWGDEYQADLCSSEVQAL